MLEGLAEAVEGTLNTQGVANTLWAYATMGREPGAGATRDLEGRTETVAGTLNTQNVANTLWAYAMIGREPGAGLMRELGEDGCGCGHVQHAGRGKLVVGGLCIFPSFRPWSRMGAYSGAATGVPG